MGRQKEQIRDTYVGLTPSLVEHVEAVLKAEPDLPTFAAAIRRIIARDRDRLKAQTAKNPS
jgi:hypothetical protein